MTCVCMIGDEQARADMFMWIVMTMLNSPFVRPLPLLLLLLSVLHLHSSSPRTPQGWLHGGAPEHTSSFVPVSGRSPAALRKTAGASLARHANIKQHKLSYPTLG